MCRSQLVEPVEQVPQRVAGGNDLAGSGREAGLKGAESSVTDDDIGVFPAETVQPQHLVRLLRREANELADQAGVGHYWPSACLVTRPPRRRSR
jgi:hypothetical protein